MKTGILASALVLALSVPALAQQTTTTGEINDRTECQANFKAADRDNNGTLSSAEKTAAGGTIPTTLANYDTISMQSYLDACRQVARQSGGSAGSGSGSGN